jgi:nucleoside 2-deoxyribosyltransferase
MPKDRIYLSMAMIGHREQMSQSLELKTYLRNAGYEVLDPYEFETTGKSPSEVVMMDLEHVLSSKLVIADLTRPSYGGGTFGEVYAAFLNGIPVITIMDESIFGYWIDSATTVRIDPARLAAFIVADSLKELIDFVINRKSLVFNDISTNVKIRRQEILAVFQQSNVR